MKSVFSSPISIASNSEMEEFLAKANLKQLKGLFPDEIDLNINKDVIGIVLNAAVVGRANRNGDAVTKENGLKCAELFKNKYVNVEHEQKKIIGCIVNVGFSSFGNNEPLTREEIEKEDFNDPFNISLALVVWKSILAEESIQFIEDSVDPSSDNYQKISASWEVFFEDYDIAVGSQNLSDAKIITDPAEKEQYLKILKAKEGSGKQGKEFVYRVLGGDFLIPAGIGLVEFPAAEVKGLEIINKKDDKEEKKEENQAKVDDKSSKLDKVNVKINNSKNKDQINKKINMKIKLSSVKDIKPELFEKVEASEVQASVQDLIQEGIVEADKEFNKQKEELSKAAELEKQAKEAAEKELQEFKENFASVEKELKELKEKFAAEERNKKYQERMEGFESEFELNDESRKVIASKLQKLGSDEDYDSFVSEMKVLLPKKQEKKSEASVETKEDKKENEDKDKEAAKEKELEKSTASEKAVEDALKDSEKKGDIPNAGESTQASLFDRMKDEFAVENICVEEKRK